MSFNHFWKAQTQNIMITCRIITCRNKNRTRSTKETLHHYPPPPQNRPFSTYYSPTSIRAYDPRLLISNPTLTLRLHNPNPLQLIVHEKRSFCRPSDILDTAVLCKVPCFGVLCLNEFDILIQRARSSRAGLAR